MSSVDGSTALVLAQGGVYGLFGVGIAATGIVVCVRARRRTDPARMGTVWLRLLFAASLLRYVFHMASSLTNGIQWLLDQDIGYDARYIRSLNITISAISTTGLFFMRLANICLILTCVEFGNGFVYALTRQHTSVQRTMRLLAFLAATPLLILAFVESGWGGSVWTEYYKTAEFGDPFQSIWNKLRRINDIGMATEAITLAVYIGLMAHAAVVKHKYRKSQPSSQTVTLYLVATILAIVPRALWNVILNAMLIYGEIYSLSDPLFQVPMHIVFDIVVWFIILMLLFVVGIRRHNGLWTIEQPWMNGLAPAPGLAHGSGGQPQLWYGQQQMMYQQGAGYGAPDQAMYYQPPSHQAGQYGWQSQAVVAEAPGVSPLEVPAGDRAHMLQSGPDLRPAGETTYEMKA